MLEKSIYIYNLSAHDIYCYTQFGQEYFDKKYRGIDALRWKHKSLLNNSLDIEKINPKRIPKDDIYRGIISVSFFYQAKDNDGKSILKTKDLRELFYKEGFDFEGKHYIRYKRSSGSSREGRCLFIEERLSKGLFPWSKCGLQASDNYQDDLVSFEAYQALTLSSIEKIITLDPHNILVVEDYNSIFKDNNSIGIDIKDGQLVVRKDEDIPISNSIWDGEGLLDESIFEEYFIISKGMVLLRNRFFKCCAFNTRLQYFFKEMMEQGVIKDVKDLNGYTEAKRIEDIKLVITHSSLKYLKFSNKTIEERIHTWMENVSNTFGVVKTDKPTHEFRGQMVDTSYQLINTVGMNQEEVNELVKPYLEYREMIRNDSDMFSFYTKMHKFENPNGDKKERKEGYEKYLDYNEMSLTVCHKLMNYNYDFKRSKLYGQYVSGLMNHFREQAYLGRILISGTNATLFGNGYELLLNTVHRFNKDNPSSLLNNEEIMCHHFNDGELLVGARNPHITMGNLLLAKNIYHPEIDKYFNLSNEVVVVNAINENIQQKLNGADYDSDTMLLTNNKIIVDAVKRNYHLFKVPVCLASSTNLTHKCLKKDQYKELARIDIDISQNHIGEAVNLSQILNSIYWDKLSKGEVDELDNIYETIAKLAVLSGMEIDKAKRSYDINVLSFLKETRDYAYRLSDNKKPLFFYSVNRISPYSYSFINGKKVSSIDKEDYKPFNTPMDYLVLAVKASPLKPLYRTTDRINLSDLVNKYKTGGTGYVFARDFLTLVKDLKRTIDQIYQEGYDSNLEETIVISEVNYKLNDAIDVLKNGLKNPATLYSIITALENDPQSDKYILLALYLVLEDKYQAWKDLFIHKPSNIEIIEGEGNGFYIFDKKYTKVPKKAKIENDN